MIEETPAENPLYRGLPWRLKQPGKHSRIGLHQKSQPGHEQGAPHHGEGEP